MDKKTELKAKAYDLLVQIEQHHLAIQQLRKQLQEVNAELQKASELPDKDAA